MGPTGITAMIAGKRAFNVKAVEKGSPADGKIWPGDQIVGAGRMPFLKRVRFEFAAAIDEAMTEKKKGVLVLMVRRKNAGKRLQRVSLQLKIMGQTKFTDTAPYNCPKIDALITDAADYIVSKKARSPYGRLNVGLLGLLATGEDKYIKVVRDHLHNAEWAKPPKDPMVLVGNTNGYTSWYWGYKMLVLTEYHLLSGDKYVLPAIRMYAESMAAGQDAAGIWGHRMHDPRTGRAFGYGPMNQPTMPVFISLILARKCGVDSPRITAAVKRTTDHYSRIYVGNGCLNYGNHGANSKGYNNNGTSGSLAVAFSTVGHKEGARFFAKMSLAAYGDLESGHATWFFNPLWTTLGANIGGPNAAAAFFKKTSWLRTLSLDWKGGYTYELDQREGLGNTGAALLNFCAGRRKLYITGKGTDPSIHLSAEEATEVLGVHKYVNALSKMKIDELYGVIGNHWSPKIRRIAAWKMLKFKRDDIEARVRKLLKAKRKSLALTAVGRLWDKTPQIFDEVAAIMRDRKEDVELRAKAAGILGAIAWARYIEPEENFGKADFYDGGQLHKPALKYFADLVQVIVEDEKDDPFDALDIAAGGALASLGNPYKQKLITDKVLFYKAVNKLLVCKHSSGARTAGMKLIADSMPLEDLHYVADAVVSATKGTDRSYTVYRGDGAVEAGVKMLWRLGIKEAIDLCIESVANATRGESRARRLATLKSFGGSAKEYLQRLKAAIKKGKSSGAADGETKDFPISDEQISEFIQAIENSTNIRKLISLEEAKRMGLGTR